MKNFKLLFLIVLFSGCYDYDPDFIDERLKPYVDQFYLEAESRGVVLSKNLMAEVKEISNPGRSIELGKNHIIIDKSYLDSRPAYSYDVELIVFHELGHALLNKGHDDSRHAIMNRAPCPRCYVLSPGVRIRWIDYLFKR